jgi:triacylglycerol esterase/lipase EstA (alpha/beta hydrolase family)
MPLIAELSSHLAGNFGTWNLITAFTWTHYSLVSSMTSINSNHSLTPVSLKFILMAHRQELVLENNNLQSHRTPASQSEPSFYIKSIHMLIQTVKLRPLDWNFLSNLSFYMNIRGKSRSNLKSKVITVIYFSLHSQQPKKNSLNTHL